MLLVLLWLAAVPTKVTAKNWEHHPSVEASRTVFTEVRAALDAKALTPVSTPDCKDELASYQLATDAKGVVRYFLRDFGSEDSSQKVESYYDASGRLRFVFIKVGAVPSAWVEQRYWLDEAGTIVWKARSTGGEGPTYYATDAKDYLVKKPTYWVAERGCGRTPQRVPSE